MAQAIYRKDFGTIDYTPVADVDAGDVVVQKNIVGVAKLDIPANTKGALAVEGEFEVVKKTGAWAVGDVIFWDVDGDPVGGTAGSGAASTVRSAGDMIMGHAVEAAASGDATGKVMLRHYGS